MTSPEALPYPVLTPFGAQSLVDVADVAARMQFGLIAAQLFRALALLPFAQVQAQVRYSIVFLPVVTAAVPAGSCQQTRPQSVSKAEENAAGKAAAEKCRKEALHVHRHREAPGTAGCSAPEHRATATP